MAQSEKINELAAALCVVQSQLHGANKNSANPFFKSSYADLQSVWESCRSLLADNGLSVVQCGQESRDGHIAIRTVLMHSSGQWIDGVTELPLSKKDPQQAGSAITYARRYSLAAMVGIYQVDDDANGATHGKPSQPASDFEKTKAELWAACGKDREALSGASDNAFGIADPSALDLGQMKQLIQQFRGQS